jgi:hypothetical protein
MASAGNDNSGAQSAAVMVTASLDIFCSSVRVAKAHAEARQYWFLGPITDNAGRQPFE